MSRCYRCTKSLKFLPPDFVEQWGILYGHGLGSTPVSPVYDTRQDDLHRTNSQVAVHYAGAPEDVMLPVSQPKPPIEAYDHPDAWDDIPAADKMVLPPPGRPLNPAAIPDLVAKQKTSPMYAKLLAGYGLQAA